MKKEIYKATATGDLQFLKDARAHDVEAAVAVYSDEDLLGLTSRGNNIIHVAAQYGHLDFIKMAFLECFDDATRQRKLICGTNSDGDTPLHMAAKLQTSAIAEHLVEVVHPSCPWRIQNNKGNSPLHVALMNGGKSIQVAEFLLKVGPEVASYTNHRKETPLHLAVVYDNQGAEISMRNTMNTINGLGASLDYTKGLFEKDSLSMIKKLLDITTIVCCLQDEDGMTPLLRATINSYLAAVIVIIDYCPESMEICDPMGKTLLHLMRFSTFLDARKFLKIPGLISTLMDQQDNDKNTPLHMAIINCDYNMVTAMIECNANFAIKNKEGSTPAALIQSNSSSFLDKAKEYIRQRSTTKDEVMSSNELFEKAYKGQWEYLIKRLNEADSEKQFLSRRLDGSNILHLAVLSCDDKYPSSVREQFILEAAKKYPILTCQTDSNGCTPLHCAMPNYYVIYDEAIITMLESVRQQQICFLPPPWEAKDLHGDTLLHLALRYRRYSMAEFLIEISDAKLLEETNNSMETPLHSLCRCNGILGGNSNGKIRNYILTFARF